MITTYKVSLTKQEYFKFLLFRYLKKRWWLFTWIFVLALILGYDGIQEAFDLFVVIMSVLYPLFIIYYFRNYAFSKDNKLMLAERYYEIDNDKINGIIDEDTSSPIKLEHFIKVESFRDIYLLYISKTQFVYIPVNSFKTESDRKWFEQEIITKINP